MNDSKHDYEVQCRAEQHDIQRARHRVNRPNVLWGYAALWVLPGATINDAHLTENMIASGICTNHTTNGNVGF